METLNSPAPRTPLNIEVEYRKSYAREESQGVLKNISITGAFLASGSGNITSGGIKTGEKLSLKFCVSGRERNVQAVVVWNNTNGCGVKFLPTNNRDIQIIDDLIYFVENKRTDTKGILHDILKKVS